MYNPIKFIKLVHAETIDAGQKFVLWRNGDKQSVHCTDFRSAEFFIEQSQKTKQDIYTGIGVFETTPLKGRGTTDEVTGLVGVAADIDFAGEGHKNKNYPKGPADVQKILDRLGAKPTLIVQTGGGWHAWWKFKEPWIFKDREKAKQLVKRWIQTLQAHAKEIGGWDIDPTTDITRVFRIPGTLNTKYAMEVELIHDSGPSYEPEDLEQFLREDLPEEISTQAKQSPSSVQDEIIVRPNCPIPLLVTELISRNDPFRSTWNFDRKDLGADINRYDMAIASALSRHGSSDQEIAETIVSFRREKALLISQKTGKPIEEIRFKGRRPDYLKRTIEKARKETLQQQLAQGLEHLPEDPTTTDSEEARKLLSQIFGKPIIKMVKYISDPTIYEFEFKGIDEAVRIGSASEVNRFSAVRDRLFEHRILLNKKLAKDWPKIVALLLCIEEEVVIPEAQLNQVWMERLREYLRTTIPEDEENLAEALEHSHPIVKESWLCLSSGHFYDYLKFKDPVQKNEIYRGLRRLGFENRGLKSSKTGQNRNYWWIPLEKTKKFFHPRELVEI